MCSHWLYFLGGAALVSLSVAILDEEGPNRGHHQINDYVTSNRLQEHITTEGLMGHLAEIQSIAGANGGHRAFGYSGYDASLEYVRSKVDHFSNRSTSWTQNFIALFNRVDSVSFEANGVSYFVHGLGYSPSTSIEGISAELVLGPTGDAGCTPEGYKDFDIKNKIVLVERGICPTGRTLAGRLRPAAASRAAAVIVYNYIPAHVTYGTLGSPDPESFVPGGFIDQADGLQLRDFLLSGQTVNAYFQQTQLIEERTSQNLFVETTSGDSENVIMLGAHLDSVLAGPGINDDGSGTSLLLELFIALQQYDLRNKVRFAWWGAEEHEMAGSIHYTSTLDATSASHILAYLNFDMVAKGVYGVFDGDGDVHGLPDAPGSDIIEKLFVDEFTSKGYEVTPMPLNRGSDYANFMDILGKPVRGLFTGAKPEQDPCYHLACDTYNNIDSTVLTVNAKATAHVLSILAMSPDTLGFKTELAALTRRELNSTQASSGLSLGEPFQANFPRHCGDHD